MTEGERGVKTGSSGIFISIVYPTIILFLQELFLKEVIATATGTVNFI